METPMAKVDLATLKPGVSLRLTVANENPKNGLPPKDRIITVRPIPQREAVTDGLVTVAADSTKILSQDLIGRGRLPLPRILRVGQDLSPHWFEECDQRTWDRTLWDGSYIQAVSMVDEPTLEEVDLLELTAGSVVTLRSATMEAGIFITGRGTVHAARNENDEERVMGNVITTSVDSWTNDLVSRGASFRHARLGQPFRFGYSGSMSVVISINVS